MAGNVKPGNTTRTMRGWAVVMSAFLLVPLAAACGNSGVTRSPEVALITVDGEAVPLELELATNFEVVLDRNTGRRDPVVLASDTILLTPPFSQSFALGGDARLLVRLKNTRPDTVEARMRISIDGDAKYDQSARLGVGGFLEFIFVSRQGP